ncbi:MAG: DUF4959 domain-containing protein [Prevotellaceae bacterium]|nr:DUF4959 domain-containing protein [Prevotellaceae bacterium]
MKTIKYMFLLMTLLLAFGACKEQGRYEIGYGDSQPPDAPVYNGRYKALYGGARLFYTIPANEDLLSIDATYLNPKGEKVWFSVSYFSDSIDVYGFSDTLIHDVQLYAVDRAGNKSQIVNVAVKPLEPAYSRVANSIIVKPGFFSFFVDWTNELEQAVNVYANFTYTKGGQPAEHNMIYTSSLASDRWFIRDLQVTEPIKVKVKVEDMYGNITDYIDMGEIRLLQDELIPKDKWELPEPNFQMGGVAMAYLQEGEARKDMLIDDVIDDGMNVNYVHTGNRGPTGELNVNNLPWNAMIDLGDKYEISRIITNQRYFNGNSPTTGRGYYYVSPNVAQYNIYIWDETTEEWELILDRHIITFPAGLSDLEFMQLGRLGDMAYLYPDDPQFTKPTRWIRYQALLGFGEGQSSTFNVNCLSEITLYGKKANQ